MIIPPRRGVNLAFVWTDQHPVDPGLRVWTTAIRAWGLSWPVGAVVLEVGCTDTHWLTMAHQYDSGIRGVGVDWRPPQPGPGTRVQGDILTIDLPRGQFDAIVMISTLEHIGLGHYDHDPIDPDGDTHTLQRCVEWLRPGGWIYADVPFNPNGYRLLNTKCRIYDEAAILTRLGTCPALQLGPAVACDLQGNLITRPTPETLLPGRGEYVYAALTWRKWKDPDATQAT